MVKTQYLAAYDVTDNDLRNATADLLKNAGMERIQYSVFYGELTRNEAEELAITFKEETIDHKAQLILIPICEACSKKQIITINEGNCPHDKESQELEETDSIGSTKEASQKDKKHPDQKPPLLQPKKSHANSNDRTQEPPKDPHLNEEAIKTREDTKKAKRQPVTPLDETKARQKTRILFF